MDQQTEASKPENARRFRKWVIRSLQVALGLALLLVLAVGGVLWYFSASLPTFDTISDYRPPQVSRMYDGKGRVVAEWFDEKRTVVPFARIPRHVRDAFLAAEDASFYHHPGLDFPGMLRALWRNLMAGHVVQGGSTITQQVIKTLLLGPERSYPRKIREILLALRLESNLSKDEIFSLYLNQIYFGHQCHGIQEASLFYFGKPVEQLTLVEAASLAALPKSPSHYSPVRYPEANRERRNWVLDQMLRNNMVTAEELKRSKAQELAVIGKGVDFFELAPYYTEHCRRLLEEKLGRDQIYRGGLRIDLAVDLDLQRWAQAAVLRGLREVDRRQGFRGPLGRMSAAEIAALHQPDDTRTRKGMIWSLVEVQGSGWKPRWLRVQDELHVVVPVVAIAGAGADAVARLDLGNREAELSLPQMKWAREFSPVAVTPAPATVPDALGIGDLIEIRLVHADSASSSQIQVELSQPPLVQGALVAIDPSDRRVLALVGGSDFRRSPLIRAVQSRRQPGSAFKPVVYAAAVQRGTYTPTTVLMDTPEVYYSSLQGSTWKPKNFERVFQGPVTLRHALAHSINTVAVKIGSDIGPETIVSMARALGIESDMTSNLSIALGASEVTPLELVNAYAAFAAGGAVEPPLFITAVKAADGTPIELPERAERKQAISEAVAFVMTSLLRSVIEEGTGKRALKLGRTLAGKTGTASEHRDAWFVGYAPDLVAGVWVGFDDHSRLGAGWAQGAGTALPIWMEFMDKALKERPKQDFKASSGVVFARVDPANGLLASPHFSGDRIEVFLEGTEPQEISSRTSSGESANGPEATSGVISEERPPEGMFH